MKTSTFFVLLSLFVSVACSILPASAEMELSSSNQTSLNQSVMIQGGINQSDYPRTIIDSAGREVTVTIPIKRIIVLCQGAAEAVTILKAEDNVVGVVDSIRTNSKMFPLLKKKPSVGKEDDPNIDMIGSISREGDIIKPNILVVCYDYPDKPYGAAAIERKLASLKNMTVAGFHFTPEIMTEELHKIGKLLGKENEAEDYLNWYSQRKSNLKKALDGEASPKVYMELSSNKGLNSLETPGKTNSLNALITNAGGDNIAKSQSKSVAKVKWDWVVSKNPDVIICMQSRDFTGWNAPPSIDTVQLEIAKNEILARPGADSVSAVKNDRIYFVPMDMLNGIKNVVGLTELAKIVHPQIDLDPSDVYGEYFERMGISYPKNKAFVYPEPKQDKSKSKA
jgi:iron complex transport system substrate-binding protein